MNKQVANENNESIITKIKELKGKAAVANSNIIFHKYEKIFSSEEFLELKQKGLKPQRLLFASTSTKNPAYSDIKYVQELIGPHTVNTLPPITMNAYLDHGDPVVTIDLDLDSEKWVFESLGSLGIDMVEVTQELEDEGVAAFASSFNSLLQSIEKKRRQAISQL